MDLSGVVRQGIVKLGVIVPAQRQLSAWADRPRFWVLTGRAGFGVFVGVRRASATFPFPSFFRGGGTAAAQTPFPPFLEVWVERVGDVLTGIRRWLLISSGS